MNASSLWMNFLWFPMDSISTRTFLCYWHVQTGQLFSREYLALRLKVENAVLQCLGSAPTSSEQDEFKSLNVSARRSWSCARWSWNTDVLPCWLPLCFVKWYVLGMANSTCNTGKLRFRLGSRSKNVTGWWCPNMVFKLLGEMIQFEDHIFRWLETTNWIWIPVSPTKNGIILVVTGILVVGFLGLSDLSKRWKMFRAVHLLISRVIDPFSNSMRFICVPSQTSGSYWEQIALDGKIHRKNVHFTIVCYYLTWLVLFPT